MDAIGIFPEIIDGNGMLILPTTGRYFHIQYGGGVGKYAKPTSEFKIHHIQVKLKRQGFVFGEFSLIKP